jgi:hypothetical protein
MQNYPPWPYLVLVVLSEDGRQMSEEFFYPFREYFDGGKEYGSARHLCERWGSEEAEAREAELGIRCVRAYVPYPVPDPPPERAIWRAILELFREVRQLIVNNPFGL